MTNKRRVAIALELDQPLPHHHDVFAGVQQYADEHPGWECIIDEHPGYKLRSRGKQARDYDGVVARATSNMVRRLRRLKIPFVNTWFQVEKKGLTGVYPDLRQTGRLAAEHLIERGFSRLSYLDIPDRHHSHVIGGAFAQRAAEEGVQCLMHRLLVSQYKAPEDWLVLERSLETWLDRLTPPVAVLLDSATVARLLITLCQQRGLKVPEDVAILCEGDTKLISMNPSPQLSCMDINFKRVGYEAATLLDRRMNGEPAPKKPILVPPKGVNARESTDFFAVEDEVVADALRYIASHLQDNLSVPRIASAVAVSRRSLQLRFEAAVGRPISEEIRRLRIELAKRMLAEIEKPIGSIAQQAGFGSSTRMNEVFRRELGMTPSDYRQQVTGE